MRDADDLCAPAQNLSFVRAASVNMRRHGDSDSAAKERRMLEVDDGHDLTQSLPMIAAKAAEWYKLLGLRGGDFAPPTAWLERPRPEDLDDHSVNAKVYRNWLIQQGFDPDDMK